MRNQYQKNDSGVNVIVELENSNNRHMWHGNKPFKGYEVLSDEEIIKLGEENISQEDKVQIYKQFLSTKKGYAVSNVTDGVVNYNDLVKLKF